MLVSRVLYTYVIQINDQYAGGTVQPYDQSNKGDPAELSSCDLTSRAIAIVGQDQGGLLASVGHILHIQ